MSSASRPSGAPVGRRLLFTRAKRSGFTADYEIRDGEHVLGGVRDNDGGAYVITLTALKSGGTAVDIVANNGR
ncbi:MAG: hypothetical protein IPG54_13670 [Sphingomonadales bacterium]|nr:hypothetical protein [Sphingomonadales bacterium]